VSKRPVIGITGRRIPAAALGVPKGFADAPVDAYFSEYAQAVYLAGGMPMHLALDSDPVAAVDHVDGLLLSGGEDVDPALYGQTPGPMTTWVDPHRDAFEVAVVHAAIAAQVPVVGICRGAQLINVACGGSLVADLPVGLGESHASYAYPRAARHQTVDFEPNSTMRQLYGQAANVNSFHHQAVDRPGVGVVVSGTARDGVTEAIEMTTAPIIGVQWHPECFGADPLFEWLIDGSRRPPGEVSMSRTRIYTDEEDSEDVA